VKKIIGIILLFLFSILTSCSVNKDEQVDFLNTNNCSAYLFGDVIDDNYGFLQFYKVSSLDEINENADFICVIVDVPKYSNFIDAEFVDSLYDLLLMDQKTIVMYYNAENYDFFRGTKFANEKNYYNNVSLVHSYNNFYGYIKKEDNSSNVVSLLTCLHTFSRKVKDYMGSL